MFEYFVLSRHKTYSNFKNKCIIIVVIHIIEHAKYPRTNIYIYIDFALYIKLRYFQVELLYSYRKNISQKLNRIYTFRNYDLTLTIKRS